MFFSLLFCKVNAVKTFRIICNIAWGEREWEVPGWGIEREGTVR